MQFASFTLIFLFLPITMLLFYLTPNRWKREVMLGISLLFLCSGGWLAAAVEILLTALTYGAGLLLEHLRQRKHLSRLVLTGSILLHFGALLLLRSDWLFSLKAGWFSGKSLFPLGLAFFTLQSVGYCIDVFRGKIHGEKNWRQLGLYLLFYPRLIMGPVVSYSVAVKSLCTPVFDIARVGQGLLRFLVGLGKKVILADNFALLIRLFRQSGETSVLFYWMYAVAFALNIYFDFSGYSDMAIGLGRVLGFHFVENFNYPYLSGSVTEFWRRWHISLGSWFRDYVYIPMGGSRVSRWRWVLNILTVWMLTGLWHGAAWNFVLWGLLFAGLLLAEKWIPVLQRLPGVLRHGYVLLAVILSFVLFNADSLAQAGQDFAGLFGFGGLSLTSAETLYYLKSYAVLFVLGILGSTPVVKNAARRIDGTKTGVVLEAAAMLALLIVCTAYLVDGSFSPFLYFRF